MTKDKKYQPRKLLGAALALPALFAPVMLAPVMFAPVSAAAQAQGPPRAPLQGPPGLFDQIGIDQRLNEQVPLELEFRDSTGQRVRLGDYFGRKPVLLSLVYYECPQLCPMVLNGISRSLKPLAFSAGKEFTVVTVSINPREGPAVAAEKKELMLRQYGRESARAGWHFLTGEEEKIKELAEAVGFRYAYDEQTKLYAHAAGIMVATPAGKLARYFYGLEYPSRDLRLGLVEASEEKIGSVVDQVLLYCYQYDPTTGKYGLVIMNTLRAAGVLTVVAIVLFIALSLRRERRKKQTEARAGA